MSSFEKVQKQRQLILAIAKRYGVSNVRVFGSVARGDDKQDSDVDFLVDLDSGRTLFDLGGFLMEVQQLLGRRVDVVTGDGLHWFVRDQVIQEAVNL
jgi:predicted nucleotidyltransferase